MNSAFIYRNLDFVVAALIAVSVITWMWFGHLIIGETSSTNVEQIVNGVLQRLIALLSSL